MDSFLTSVNAVSSMAIPLFVGILLRAFHVLKEGFNETVSDVIYSVCLPASLAVTMYTSDLRSTQLPLSSVAYTVTVLVVAFTLLCILVKKKVKDPAKAGSVVQGCFRGNASIYGIPLAISLYGESHLTEISLNVLASTVVFNVLAIAAFVICSGAKTSFKNVVLSILKNPCICGIMAGMVLNLCRVVLPGMIFNPIKAIGNVTTPLCFIAIGSSISFEGYRLNWKLASVITAVKLVILPVIAISLAVALGFRKESLVGMIAVLATPCAVGSYPMALKLGGDGPLSAQATMFTTLASVVTVFLFVFVLRSSGMI